MTETAHDTNAPPIPAGLVAWATFAEAEPVLAAAIRARFEVTKHHVLATLRRDGAPRVSGTEVAILSGEMWLGSMPGAVKAMDLVRDGRFALHSNPGDSSMEGGDAKVSGVAVEIMGERHDEIGADMGAPPGPFHAFRLDLGHAVLSEVKPDGSGMVITSWTPDGGVVRFER